MKLMEVYRKIVEQTPDAIEDVVLEFPNQNFNVSIFPEQKKLVFVPQFHNSFTEGMKSYIFMIKERFRIAEIDDLDKDDDPNDNHLQNAFAVFIDPREDFSLVTQMLRDLASQEPRE